jgi:hypothetical protein
MRLDWDRSRQRGGAALLVAFMLVVLMAAGGLATGANVARELALCAIAARTAEASEAAESGVEWFRAWVSGQDGQAFLAALATGAEAEAPAPATARFRVRVRRLGALPEPSAPAADAGSAPAPVPGPAPGPPPEPATGDFAGGTCWLLAASGASPAAGGFRQVREALLIPEPSGGFRCRTWRVADGDGRPATSATSP